jgi:uncharacterized protein (DUF58 family)
MLPEPLLRHVRRLTLRARRAAHELVAGQYESAVRGSGLTFADVRPYQPGDETRHIDWNVTARTGTPYVKRFIEERERTVWLLIDASESQTFGSPRGKRQTAAEVAALIAFAAAAQQDRVGLVHFTDQVEQVLPPRKGDRHARRLVRELFTFSPSRRGTSLAAALSTVRRKRRAVVFLVSDFDDAGWERPVKVAACRHDLIAVVVRDPAEDELPHVGYVRLADAETGRAVVLNAASTPTRAAYADAARRRRGAVAAALRSAGADRVEVTTAGGHVDALLQLFRRRECRR